MEHPDGTGPWATLELVAVQCAIVDGINVYLRDVLEPRGICDASKRDDYPGSELNTLKYEIARRIAAGYFRTADENA